MAAAVVLGLTVAGRRLGGAAALTKPLGTGWASVVGVAAWTLALLPVGITSLGRLGYPVGPVVILAVVAVLFLAEVRAPPPESSGTGSSPQGQRAVDDARRVQEQNFDAT
jgi:hypothetical protein